MRPNGLPSLKEVLAKEGSKYYLLSQSRGSKNISLANVSAFTWNFCDKSSVLRVRNSFLIAIIFL
jgi:hypothetical protein